MYKVPFQTHFLWVLFELVKVVWALTAKIWREIVLMWFILGHYTSFFCQPAKTKGHKIGGHHTLKCFFQCSASKSLISIFSINWDRRATIFSWALDCYLQTSESEILWYWSVKIPALQDLAHSLCMLQLFVVLEIFGLVLSAITMVCLPQ